jgi:hypothetical protein
MSLVALLALYLFIDPVSEAAWRAGRRLGRIPATQGCRLGDLVDEFHQAPLNTAARPVAVRVRTRAELRISR